MDPQQPRIVVKVDELDDPIPVLELRSSSGISQLFEIEILLAGRVTVVDPTSIIGRGATVGYAESKRSPIAHGIVQRFEVRDGDDWLDSELRPPDDVAWHYYRAWIVPEAWRLTQKSDCQIYQQSLEPKDDEHVTDIVVNLLKEANINHELHAKRRIKPPPREYCVQYQESDWAFIERLLAEEGYCYFFTHECAGHVLHITNDEGVHPPIEGNPALNYRRGLASSAPVDDHISQLTLVGAAQPDRVTTRDVDLDRPRLKLEETSGDAGGTIEAYVYPGGYNEPNEQGEHAQRLLQHLRQQELVVSGSGACMRLTAGKVLTIQGAELPKQAEGAKLLLVTVAYTLRQHAWWGGEGNTVLNHRVSFRGVPLTRPFRPPVLPRPRIAGVQTALVVGLAKDKQPDPIEEEIHTDALGRVKVRFPWDRRDRAARSCWIPVARSAAGPGWGTLFTPRVGHDVLIAFVDGNPDRPLIVGEVHNSVNVPPYYEVSKNPTISAIRTHSSPNHKGFNELSFDDKANRERVFLHAQRDREDVVKHDHTQRVGNDVSVSVGNEHREAIGKTFKQVVGDSAAGDSSGDGAGPAYKEVTVHGDYSQTIANNKSLQATLLTDIVKGLRREQSGSHKIAVKERCQITSAEGDIVISAGGSTLRIDEDGSVTVQVANGAKLALSTEGVVEVSGGMIKLN